MASALGFGPVRVESPQGRADYAAAQRTFAERATPLRDRLIAAIDAVQAGYTRCGTILNASGP
jgi:hypothetical protein